MHELADWVADFRANIERLRVAPDDKPGAIREQLPKRAPEEGEPFERILTDVDRIIVPGMVHWSHPMFLGYFGWTSTAPGLLGEILTAPLNVNAMTWRTCPAATELETVVIDWLRELDVLGLAILVAGAVVLAIALMSKPVAVAFRPIFEADLGWAFRPRERLPS